jgi:hypothetical protein
MSMRMHVAQRSSPAFHICGKLAAAALGAFLLHGCSSFSSNELANPAQLHYAAVAPGSTAGLVEAKANAAATLVPLRYYTAMEAAQKTGATQPGIDAYVNEGISVIDLYCLRWFSKLEDAQRSSQVNDTNRNVITQLGTTVIGLARLHTDVTAAYGAINSSVAGFNANFASAFLAAPNAENLKRLTMDALRSRAVLLKTAGSALYPRTFSEAYVQLEKLANQCTHAEVKRLTNKSVDRSEASADPNTGETILFSGATSAQGTVLKTRVESVLGKIDSLKAADAVALTRLMPFRTNPDVDAFVRAIDPSSLRFTDEKVAKATLKRVFVLTGNSEAGITEWETRLAMLAK